MSEAVALIYTVHDLSRGNVASVSDPLCAAPACHTAPLPLFHRHLLLLLLTLLRRRRPAPFLPRSLVSRLSCARVFGRVALFDLRPLATASGADHERRRRKRGNETERVEADRGSRCRLFRVTFDGRLVTRLNLRRIEYIAPTRDTYVGTTSRGYRDAKKRRASESEEQERRRARGRTRKGVNF